MSTRQTWTAIQHDGSNHLGLWLIRRLARARVNRLACQGLSDADASGLPPVSIFVVLLSSLPSPLPSSLLPSSPLLFHLSYWCCRHSRSRQRLRRWLEAASSARATSPVERRQTAMSSQTTLPKGMRGPALELVPPAGGCAVAVLSHGPPSFSVVGEGRQNTSVSVPSTKSGLAQGSFQRLVN